MKTHNKCQGAKKNQGVVSGRGNTHQGQGLFLIISYDSPGSFSFTLHEFPHVYSDTRVVN